MSTVLLDVQALRLVSAKIKERLQSEYQHVGRGTGVVIDDAAATGMIWHGRTKFIAGLEAALEFCEEVEREMSAAPKKAKEKA